MAMIGDDLAAWLVALLADAGRKKLTAIFLGGEQERALAKAADAAIRAAAAELRPGGGGATEELAQVVGHVFRLPDPGGDVARAGTALELIRSNVMSQLAVLGGSRAPSGQT
jgi:hypothetical protein